VKLTNLKIAPKLGILLGVTLLGLCAAGALAGYLMQREMFNARLDQTNARLVSMSDELVRHIVESELRTATAITEVAGTD